MLAVMNRHEKSFWRRLPHALLFAGQGALLGGLNLRLWIAVAVAFAGFGLLYGDAQAGRWLPEIENPYCAVKTYVLRNVAEQASSMTDSRGRPVIVVNGLTLRAKPDYSKFLLAHECCHHSLGHVANAKKGFGNVGPRPFLYIAPQLKRLELEADCCAVKILREHRDGGAIEAGRKAMSMFGARPTGAHYPTGIERAETIMGCAVER